MEDKVRIEMDKELVQAMKEFCIRVMKGGPDVTAAEIRAMPNVLIALERVIQQDEHLI